MTIYLVLMWCVGNMAVGCSAITIPTKYEGSLAMDNCVKAGKRAVSEFRFEAYRCVES